MGDYKAADPMTRLENMMLILSQLLGFHPSQAEIRLAKSELAHVSSDAVKFLSKELQSRSRSDSDKDIRLITNNLNMLMLSAINYRVKMEVRECRIDNNGHCFYVCPRCNTSFERDFQSYCDRCGQHLGWQDYKKLDYPGLSGGSSSAIIHLACFRSEM